MTFKESVREDIGEMRGISLESIDIADTAPPEVVKEEPLIEPELPTPSLADDPVRLYLREIGKVPLLTATQEVKIGQRIEQGQGELRRALARIPLAVHTILRLAERVRRDEIPLEALILRPDGAEPRPEDVKPILALFGRIRRLEREIMKLQDALKKRRRAASTRATYQRWITQNRAAIQSIVAELPIKPALADRLVAELRQTAVWIKTLARRAATPGKRAEARRELRELEARWGFPAGSSSGSWLRSRERTTS